MSQDHSITSFVMTLSTDRDQATTSRTRISLNVLSAQSDSTAQMQLKRFLVQKVNSVTEELTLVQIALSERTCRSKELDTRVNASTV